LGIGNWELGIGNWNWELGIGNWELDNITNCKVNNICHLLSGNRHPATGNQPQALKNNPYLYFLV
jgi:hypothetical protein